MTAGTTQDPGTGPEDSARPHERMPHNGKPHYGGLHSGGLRSDPPRLRASDAERSATVDVLHDAVTRGLLTPDEGSERMAAAFAARYRDDLPALTADLPPGAEPAAALGWRRLGSSLVAQLRQEVSDGRAAGLRSQRVLALVLAVVLAAVLGLGMLGVLGVLGALMVHGVADGTHAHVFEHALH